MIRFGIIGFGLAAKVFHLPILTRQKGGKVTAVYSSKPPSEINERLPDTQVFNSIDTFFNDAEIDVVVILTPNDLHAKLATRALENDLHVIIDKPFVCNVEEGLALIELAKGKNKLLTTYHNRRWDGDFLTISKLLAENKLGDVTYFESRFDKYRPRVWGRWREQDLPGAGLMYDLGSHLVDQALTLFGKPNKVRAKILQQRKGAKTTDYFDIELAYRDKDKLVRLRGSSLARKTPFRFYIEGTQGSFIKKEEDVQESQFANNMSPYDDAYGKENEANYGRWYRMPPDGNIQNKEHDEPIEIDTEKGTYQLFYENFIDAYHGTTELNIKPEQALDVIKVMELATRSSDLGQEVNFE